MIEDLNELDLDADTEAVTAIKRPIPVPVYFAATAGVIATLEGPVAHEAGAAILRGVRGELWPLSLERFRTEYAPGPQTAMGSAGIYTKKPNPVRAKRILGRPFTVSVGASNQPIYGNPGDWLVQYSARRRSVISDQVFRASYEIVSAAPEAADCPDT